MINPTLNSDSGSVDSLAQLINSSAHVGSGIFSISSQNIQSNKSKVMSSSEPVSSPNFLAIDQPFNTQVGIIDRLQAAFQMDMAVLSC